MRGTGAARGIGFWTVCLIVIRGHMMSEGVTPKSERSMDEEAAKEVNSKRRVRA